MVFPDATRLANVVFLMVILRQSRGLGNGRPLDTAVRSGSLVVADIALPFRLQLGRVEVNCRGGEQSPGAFGVPQMLLTRTVLVFRIASSSRVPV